MKKAGDTQALDTTNIRNTDEGKMHQLGDYDKQVILV